MSDSLFTVDSAAEKLDVHPRTILRFINQGKLKAFKVGRQWRIKKGDLYELLGETVSERKSTASSVIDFPVKDENEANRFITLFTASLNSRNGYDSTDRRADFMYNREENSIRIVLWGSLSFMKDFYTLIGNYSIN